MTEPELLSTEERYACMRIADSTGLSQGEYATLLLEAQRAKDIVFYEALLKASEEK